MSYRAIDIERFLSLMSTLAGATVCLSAETVGHIRIFSTRLQPWPALIEQVATQNGLNITMSNELILARGKIR